MNSLFQRAVRRQLMQEEDDVSNDEEPAVQPDIPEDARFNVIRNINTYARTKTLAQGFLDMALFTANASQMKHLLQEGPQTQFYYFLLVCLSISIGLQLIVAALLIYKGSKNIERDDPERSLSDRVHLLNNIVTGLILVITAVNVFITAFWFTSSHPPAADLSIAAASAPASSGP